MIFESIKNIKHSIIVALIGISALIFIVMTLSFLSRNTPEGLLDQSKILPLKKIHICQDFDKLRILARNFADSQNHQEYEQNLLKLKETFKNSKENSHKIINELITKNSSVKVEDPVILESSLKELESAVKKKLELRQQVKLLKDDIEKCQKRLNDSINPVIYGVNRLLDNTKKTVSDDISQKIKDLGEDSPLFKLIKIQLLISRLHPVSKESINKISTQDYLSLLKTAIEDLKTDKKILFLDLKISINEIISLLENSDIQDVNDYNGMNSKIQTLNSLLSSIIAVEKEKIDFSINNYVISSKTNITRLFDVAVENLINALNIKSEGNRLINLLTQLCIVTNKKDLSDVEYYYRQCRSDLSHLIEIFTRDQLANQYKFIKNNIIEIENKLDSFEKRNITGISIQGLEIKDEIKKILLSINQNILLITKSINKIINSYPILLEGQIPFKDNSNFLFAIGTICFLCLLLCILTIILVFYLNKNHIKTIQKAQNESGNTKNNIMANISHEIRTPMNAIIGMVDLLYSPDMPKKEKQYYEVIRTSARNLLNLIDDILDFSKIENGIIEIESIPFNLLKVVEHIPDIFQKDLSNKEIELIIHLENDVPCSLIGDPTRLRHIIENLLSNAVKFTEKGEIMIHIECEKKYGNNARLNISIKDTGIGISQDEMDKIFQPFHQVDGSTTRKYGGVGLGLNLCKSLVELMGGEINVTSEPYKGSTFSFNLNFQIDTIDKEKDKLNLSDKFSNLKILIIEPNKTQARVLKDMAELFDITAHKTQDSREALEMIQKNDYQIILLNWLMPEMDGFETANKIKAQEKSQNISIIMMGYHGLEKEIKKDYAKNIDDYLYKPVKRTEFIEKMKNYGKKQPQKLSKNVEEKKLQDKKVLLAEDNLFNQQVAMEILKREKLIIEIAGTGKEVINALENDSYDLVLMDLQMPEMDGLEATKEIRKDKKYDNLPIIAMTAHTIKGSRDQCIEAGMNDFISKPINRKELISTLNKWLGNDDQVGKEKKDVIQIKQTPVKPDTVKSDTVKSEKNI